MTFDADRFISEKWQRREHEIDVPTLKEFFGQDEKPVWKIQSLEGSEIARARFAKDRNIRIKANLDSIAEIISSKNSKKIKDQISEIFGNVEGEADVAWRTELLIYGSAEPKVDYPLASMLFKVKPTEYYSITNEIIRICGLGHEPGKPKPSGETKKSKQL